MRGTAVARRYFRREDEEILDEEGYFDTGDVATIDALGYMRITDRSKDVISPAASGSPRSSSRTWRSRTRRSRRRGDRHRASEMGRAPAPRRGGEAGCTPAKEDLLEFLRPRVARWWMPDDVVMVDEIPHTATGRS